MALNDVRRHQTLVGLGHPVVLTIELRDSAELSLHRIGVTIANQTEGRLAIQRIAATATCQQEQR